MQNFSIGLSGLNAASTALEVIGNNIANASTPGYHRQRVELTPSTYGQMGGDVTGVGVDVSGVTRLVDKLLEAEIMRQQSAQGQVSQELSILTAVETTFGEFTEEGGLNMSIDNFFDALRGLAAHPLEQVWRNDTISSAEVVCDEFRRLGAFMTNLEDQVALEARSTADSINVLISQIAELNGKIQSIEISQGQANNLRDARDQLISELAELTAVETQEREYGIVDVSMSGLPVVTGVVTVGIQVNLLSDGTLDLSAAGAEGQNLDVGSGRLGALFSLKNELLRDMRDDLDTLAKTIIDSVNRYHVQGLGVDGSFTELSGGSIPTVDLASGGLSVMDGTFYIRVTDTNTGAIERHAIDVDVSGAAPDTPESIAAKIDAIAGLSASIRSSQLHVIADMGYTFDFLPEVLPEPAAATLTAASPPSVAVAGIYSDAESHTFTFTVVGTGSVGVGNLRLDVADEDGALVGTLDIGQVYAAGDVLKLRNGLKITLSTGQLNDGDSFEVEALATSDTSGFLAAAGMNTFFSGATASEMRVRDEIADAPDRIATALGRDLSDNAAALQLAAVREERLDALTGMTLSEYYHRIVADVGQQVDSRQSRQDNIEAMVQNLQKRRGELSDVNINDEAAQLLVFEKMFQAMAKYLSTLQTTMATLMEIT